MLLSFSIENFRSIRDSTTIDFSATHQKPAYSWLKNNVALSGKKDKVLKVKAIYGANASGKSTLLLAMSVWQGVALLSGRDRYEQLPVEPFRLDAAYSESPTTLCGTFVYGDRKYEYGLEMTRDKIVREWLLDRSVRKATVFTRQDQTVTPNPEYFGKDDRLTFLLKENNEVFQPRISFLAAASLLKIAPVVDQVAAALRKLMILSDAGLHHLEELPAQLMYEDGSLLRETSEMLKLLGIDHDSLLSFDKEKISHVKELPGLEKFSDQTDKRFFTVTTRKVKGREDKSLAWLSDQYESAGTQKILQLAPLIIICLRQGGILLVDEFEARLHTRLSREIVQLFNSTSGNPNGAQFIFSTHDTNLLDNKLLRRDQIALIEKDDSGASFLYSLSDITGVTNTANFEREYLGGSYGAVPQVSDLDIALDLEPAAHE